jgi:hypothetical protein
MTQVGAGLSCRELPSRRNEVAFGDLHQNPDLEIGERATVFRNDRFPYLQIKRRNTAFGVWFLMVDLGRVLINVMSAPERKADILYSDRAFPLMTHSGL